MAGSPDELHRDAADAPLADGMMGGVDGSSDVLTGAPLGRKWAKSPRPAATTSRDQEVPRSRAFQLTLNSESRYSGNASNTLHGPRRAKLRPRAVAIWAQSSARPADNRAVAQPGLHQCSSSSSSSRGVIHRLSHCVLGARCSERSGVERCPALVPRAARFRVPSSSPGQQKCFPHHTDTHLCDRDHTTCPQGINASRCRGSSDRRDVWGIPAECDKRMFAARRTRRPRQTWSPLRFLCRGSYFCETVAPGRTVAGRTVFLRHSVPRALVTARTFPSW